MAGKIELFACFFMGGNTGLVGRLGFFGIFDESRPNGIGAVCVRKRGTSPEKVEGAVCAPDGF